MERAARQREQNEKVPGTHGLGEIGHDALPRY